MFKITREESKSEKKSKEKEEKPILFQIEDANVLNLLKKKTLRFKVKKKSLLRKNDQKSKGGRWTLDEHINFLEAIDKYGTNWKKIEKGMSSKTRTRIQIISHFQKFFKKLKSCKDAKLGIDFTSKSIVNLEDMKKHIKTVNNTYKIVDIFLHFTKDWSFRKQSKKIKNKQINVINQINNINLNFPLNNNFIINNPINNINNNLIPQFVDYLNNTVLLNKIFNLYLLNTNNNYINYI